MSYRDIKRIANRFSRVYDPNRNNNGLLVEESQKQSQGLKMKYSIIDIKFLPK